MPLAFRPFAMCLKVMKFSSLMNEDRELYMGAGSSFGVSYNGRWLASVADIKILPLAYEPKAD